MWPQLVASHNIKTANHAIQLVAMRQIFGRIQEKAINKLRYLDFSQRRVAKKDPCQGGAV